jgi:hypothetical protein
VRQGGRTKGTPNKFNADIKGMILGALSDVGGRDYLAARAKDQPVAFMGLLGKVLPLQIAGTGQNGALVVDFRWASDTPAPLTVDAVVDTQDTSVDTDADTPAIEWSEAEPKGHAD